MWSFIPNPLQLKQQPRQLRDVGSIRRASSTRFLIFIKAQSSGFDIIALSSSGSQLKGPPNGGLLFAFRSVQDCNSSGSLAILLAIRRASSRLSNFAADLRPGSSSK
jgi:hypothetical protein